MPSENPFNMNFDDLVKAANQKVDSEPEAETKVETKPETKAKSEPKTEAKAKAKTETDSIFDNFDDLVKKSEIEAKPKAETKEEKPKDDSTQKRTSQYQVDNTAVFGKAIEEQTDEELAELKVEGNVATQEDVKRMEKMEKSTPHAKIFDPDEAEKPSHAKVFDPDSESKPKAKAETKPKTESKSETKSKTTKSKAKTTKSKTTKSKTKQKGQTTNMDDQITVNIKLNSKIKALIDDDKLEKLVSEHTEKLQADVDKLAKESFKSLLGE